MDAFHQTIEDAHRTLGLSVFADEMEVRMAWRAKARATHPDHGGNSDDFQEAFVAAQILLDEGVRDYYKSELLRSAEVKQARANATPPKRGYVNEPHSNLVPARTRHHRHPALLIAAIFGVLIAPHFIQLGVTWTPLLDLCAMMHILDWVFFAAWIWIKSPRE